jgi:hypothetical protein
VKDWNAFFVSIGHGMDAGRQPWEGKDTYWASGFERSSPKVPRTRLPLTSLPPSAWRRIVAARFAVLCDLEPCDLRIQKLSDYLSREDGRWIDWCSDPALQTLYARLLADKERWSLVRMLEEIAVQRGMRARERRSAVEPFRMSFTTAREEYVFALPSRPLQGHGRTVLRSVAWVFAAREYFIRHRAIDDRVLAAAAWKAGRY